MKFIFLFSLLFVVGCSALSRSENALHISKNINFSERHIQAHPFILTSYERVNIQNGVANIYIEGDGFAWLSKNRASLDPTPKNPVALKLASQDLAHNVIYLARPCQYTKLTDKSACPQKYWTSHRFAPEVIKAMDSALDDIKRRHQITKFNLIGFSGGGNIAALLTARRDDVLSLRTVAGNLDHQLQSDIHNVSPMLESLNAKDISNQISNVPQIHFIGGKDSVVPYALYNSYQEAAGSRNCLRAVVIEHADHVQHWNKHWTDFLKEQPVCGE